MKSLIDTAKKDIGKILNNGGYVFRLDDGSEIYGVLNKSTPIFFDNGTTSKSVTALLPVDTNIKVGDRLECESQNYEISKIELESQVLKRIYLRLI
ncbi:MULTISPECIES: hypothetical protein [unclassified Campylobacter]|uniref:hypothetical protein n=1 Tax=unclassified Campylobacter TaxID=2593542 RepID=UPI003D354113